MSFEYNSKIINALRYLKRVKVKIPYSEKLVNIFCPENVIVRTHFPRFMGYIQGSCAFHQFQRQKDNDGYYIATEQDYEIARICLMKTTSNILMIPLTKLQKNILDAFEKDNLQRKSVDDMESVKKIEKLNITSEWLRKQIDYLSSKSFLIKDKEARYDENGKKIPKPVFIYSYNKLQALVVPKWEDLDKVSSDTNNYNFTTNSSNTSNSGVVNEVIEVFRQERETSICSKCGKKPAVFTNGKDNFCKKCAYEVQQNG